ncbi:MAG: SOS response-associated peptidase family protein [Flavisolibacter sp.]|nr:SOS response-associated peptidase family protein [Flavisolibacter sp.]
MCYYNGQKVTRDEFIRLKHLEKLVSKYQFLNRDVINGFDFGKSAVLIPTKKENGQEDVELVQMEWGFIPDPLTWPFWETREQVNVGRYPHKDHRGNFVEGLNFLNAVSEEILFKNKVYRKAAIDRRCLFLSSGFYEWRHIFPINKKTGERRKTSVKYPYRIGLKDREFFWMAGIWQQWEDAETGEVVDTAAIVTTKANQLMKQIHNTKERQPTMLSDGLAWEWIFGSLNEKRIQEIASWQIPYEELDYYTLAKDFLSSHDPLKSYYYHDLPPLEVPGGDLNTAVPAGDQQLGLF